MTEREKLVLDVSVEDRAANASLSELERSANDAEQAVEDLGLSAEDAGRLLVAMAQDADTQIRNTAEAADALAQALGPELSAKVDTKQVVSDLEKMGVTADEIKGNVDTLAASLKEIDQIDVKNVEAGFGGLGQKLRETSTDTGDLGESARSSRNALANMVGNSAQDISGLNSSLGVAIGQLAEFSADAALSGESLKTVGRNMALVLGPVAGLAALTFGIQKVQSSLADLSAAQEAYRQQQIDFNAAVDDSGSVVSALNDMLQANTELMQRPELNWWQDLANDLPFVGRAIDETVVATTDLQSAMAAAGITAEEWVNALRVDIPGGGQRYVDLQNKILALKDAGTITEEQFNLLNEQFVLYGELTARAGSTTDVFKSSVTGMSTALTDFRTQQAETEAAWATLIRLQENGTIRSQEGADAWNTLRENLHLTNEELAAQFDQRYDQHLEDQRQAALDAAAAQAELNQKIAETGATIDNILEGIPDFGSALQAKLDVADTTIDFQSAKASVDDAIDELQAFIDEHDPVDWSALLDTSQIAAGDLDPQLLGLVQGVRDSMQEGIVSAFDIGGVGAAQHFLDTFVPQLMAQGGLTLAQVYELLGLPPDGSIEAIIEPIVDAENASRARAILDALAGTGIEDPRIAAIQVALETESISDDLAFVASLLLAQDMGIAVSFVYSDGSPVPQADIDAAQQWLDGNPVTVTAEADTRPAEKALVETTSKKRLANVEAQATNVAQAAGQLDGIKTDKTKGGNRVAPIHAAIVGAAAAELLLDLIARTRTATINIRTGSIDVPTAQEIANRIGTVRVPIDAYIRHVPRINGTRG